MTRLRLTGFALALAFLGGAARTWGEETEPRIEVQARVVSQDAQRVRIEVVARAPLPDGIEMIVEFWGTIPLTGADRMPFVSRRALMRGGYCRESFNLKYPSELLPGDYRVTVRVDADKERSRRLSPALRRLDGEGRVLVGGRTYRCKRINVLTEKIFKHIKALQIHFPLLEKMLDRAYHKELPEAEWRLAAKFRIELERHCRELKALASEDGDKRFMPITMCRVERMTDLASSIIESIEDYLKGNTKHNDKLLKPRDVNPAGPDEHDEVTGLINTLDQEGAVAYAFIAEQTFLDVDAAYSRLRGTGSDAWENLKVEWWKMIDETKALMKEYDKLDWPIERGDQMSQLEDVLIEIKMYANLCGRHIKGSDAGDDAERKAKREEILRRIRRISPMIK